MSSSSRELHNRFAGVRLLSLDVDGVQTDGGLYYSETGAEMRRFHVRDGLGIKQVMASGLPVIFITQSATPSIRQRAQRLGITRCFDAVDSKLSAVTAFCREIGIGLDQVAHMGDDVNDLELMRAVGCPATVVDARPEIIEIAVWQSTLPAGAGAVREFCDALLSSLYPEAQRSDTNYVLTGR